MCDRLLYSHGNVSLQFYLLFLTLFPLSRPMTMSYLENLSLSVNILIRVVSMPASLAHHQSLLFTVCITITALWRL